MSTKTTFKRVALVAVAALGLGVVTAVAPASAAQVTPGSIAFGSVSNLRAGVAGSVTVTLSLPAGTAIGDSVTVLARVTSAPATSFATAKAAVPGTAAISSTAATSSTGIWWGPASSGSGSYGTYGNNAAGANSTNSYNSAGTTADVSNWTTSTSYVTATGDSATSISLKLNILPDATGSYSILVSLGTSNASYDTPAELIALTNAQLTTNLSTSVSTLTTGSTPTTATLAAVTTGAPKGGTYGALWKLTLDGGLGTSETIALSSNSSTVTFKSHTGGALTNNTLTSSNFSAGVAYFTVQNSVAETATITASGSGLLSSSVTGSGTVTHVTPTATLTTTPTISLTTATTAMAGTDTTAGTNDTPAGTSYYAARTTSTSQSVKVTATAAEIFTATVTDTSGKATGKGGAIYDKTGTIGTLGTATFSVPATLAAGESVTVVIGAVTRVITGRASTPTTVTITNASRRSALLGANTFVATVKDQYGSASTMASQTVTVSVTGRNATTTATSYTTDALGQVSYTLTDAGTTGLSDTVTFTTSTGSKTASATVSYGSAVAGEVALEGPNNADTVITYGDKQDIVAGSGGAEDGAVGVEATVTDAAGNVMGGMPVTFTVSGTGCAILSTTALLYTGADGTATTSVYAWIAGKCVVTATSGGKSITEDVYFAQKTATEARTITASASGNTVTGTVKDRFGNVVTGVTVWASRTGSGSFGGSSSSSAVTGEDGTVQFVLSNGTADIKLALGSTASADVEYGQSSSTSGKICDGAGCTDTALVAATVGTATTAETYVGSSIAPAGVNSATVTAVSDTTTNDTAQGAADAAAEATDAANAATDAANAAAEAADAATAAAQDAADAVAALSAQVATLISGLKAQLTALTNLVIKIQKKVKA